MNWSSKKIFLFVIIVFIISSFSFLSGQTEFIDRDGDGLSDEYEESIGTDSNNADTDGDDISDGKEILYGFSPKNMDSDGNGIIDSKEVIYINSKDSDGDSIPDFREEGIYNTDPNNADTDGDGVSDSKEIFLGTDPNNKNLSDNSNTKNYTEESKYKYKIKIHLGAGSSVTGIIDMDSDTIPIKTKIDGFYYEQDFPLSKINSIEILEWYPYLKSSNYNKDEKITEYTYCFYPFKYKIKLLDDSVYYQKTRMENFEEAISFNNDYGTTNIYFFFIDYWIVNSKNKGHWHNSKFTDFDANNKNPNPLTVTGIEIIELIAKEANS